MRALATHLIATLLLVAGLALASAAFAGAALQEPPGRPDPKAHYLFYLHGKIIEEQGRRPTHPRFGVYEYDAVLGALGAQGAVVISAQRAAGARVAEHAAQIGAQVRRLVEAGVPQAQVAVVGFSKGGLIAAQVSAALDLPGVRYVLLAACPAEGEGPARLHGQVLAIREKSDDVPSCAPLFARSRGSATTRELVVALGGGHGAFYRPQAAWVDPLLAFVR